MTGDWSVCFFKMDVAGNPLMHKLQYEPVLMG
jgi:hypothetical protein